jgi:hypothetical protein
MALRDILESLRLAVQGGTQNAIGGFQTPPARPVDQMTAPQDAQFVQGRDTDPGSPERMLADLQNRISGLDISNVGDVDQILANDLGAANATELAQLVTPAGMARVPLGGFRAKGALPATPRPSGKAKRAPRAKAGAGAKRTPRSKPGAQHAFRTPPVGNTGGFSSVPAKGSLAAGQGASTPAPASGGLRGLLNSVKDLSARDKVGALLTGSSIGLAGRGLLNQAGDELDAEAAPTGPTPEEVDQQNRDLFQQQFQEFAKSLQPPAAAEPSNVDKILETIRGFQQQPQQQSIKGDPNDPFITRAIRSVQDALGGFSQGFAGNPGALPVSQQRRANQIMTQQGVDDATQKFSERERFGADISKNLLGNELLGQGRVLQSAVQTGQITPEALAEFLQGIDPGGTQAPPSGGGQDVMATLRALQQAGFLQGTGVDANFDAIANQ